MHATATARASAFKTRGVVLVPEDLSLADWPERAAQAGLTTIALHHGASPKAVADFIESPSGQEFLRKCARLGLQVEYELHAMRELLPRSLFATEPALFRVNEKGERTPDANLCVHSARALEIITTNALRLARQLKPTTGRYFFWGDDGQPWCRCPWCREFSDSDQALLLENHLVSELRKLDPQAQLAHLAYANTLAAPTRVKPMPGVFLEFAPIQRRYDLPYTEQTGTQDSLQSLEDNLRVFPDETAQALEYWLDVSRFSRWKRPAVKLPWRRDVLAADAETYLHLGLRHVTTFAVWMDADYTNRFGAPLAIQEYGETLREQGATQQDTPAVSPRAGLYSPRIVSPHNADAYSLKTLAQFQRWQDLTGDAKVFEIFKYLADRRTGLYPLGVPAREGPEDLPEYGAVTDPVKMLNIYPIGHCGTLGPTAAGLLEGMGIGPARTLIIPGWNHVAAEVFYGNRWHYFDLDVRAVFRRENGSLASMEEARTEASLWTQPNGPLFFPLDELGNVRWAYVKTPADHRYGVASGGHTMDFLLRPGETFTRWWKPQGGRWDHHPSYAAKPFPRNVLEREPRGPKCKHASFTIHTHGNGRFVYRPNLTAASSDFQDGLYDAQNVQAGPAGLTRKAPGEGYAIFEVRTPYVIVPWVGDLESSDDNREASIVKLDTVGAEVALSVDNGLTWQRLSAKDGVFDLTPQVSGRYGYLLKIGLRGEPEKAVVRSLEIVTWVQVHPASLPALRQGTNLMRLVSGDHYGLATRVVAVCPNGADREDFLKHLLELPKDYDPARRTSRVRGAFVAKVQPPPGTKIAWFSAGASFTASVGATQNTRNAIDYAVNEPAAFRDIYRANVPADQSHWHYNVDREVKLDEPARMLFVRYVGEPAVNNIRLFAHCLEDRPRAPAPVMITHAWSENGMRKSKQVKLDGPGEYEIEAGADPVDESIEIAIPSRVRVSRPSQKQADVPPTQPGRF